MWRWSCRACGRAAGQLRPGSLVGDAECQVPHRANRVFALERRLARGRDLLGRDIQPEVLRHAVGLADLPGPRVVARVDGPLRSSAPACHAGWLRWFLDPWCAVSVGFVPSAALGGPSQATRVVAGRRLLLLLVVLISSPPVRRAPPAPPLALAGAAARTPGKKRAHCGLGHIKGSPLRTGAPIPKQPQGPLPVRRTRSHAPHSTATTTPAPGPTGA